MESSTCLGGYINSSGVIDLSRLQTIMDELSLLERETFEKENSDLNWYKGKQSSHNASAHTRDDKNGAILSLIYETDRYITSV